MGFAGVAFQSRAAALAELQHCPQFHDAILTLSDGAMFSAPACLLYARSKWFRRAWEDAPGSGFGKCVEIAIPPVPGGTDAFESILQYCYGLPVNADATNALQLLCCAAFFEMCEGSEEDSLQRQAWRYINEYVLNEWEDSLRLLETVARDELVMREALKLDLPLHASACVAGTERSSHALQPPPARFDRLSATPSPRDTYHLSAMLSGPFDSPTRTASLHHLLARLAALPTPVLSCVLQACRQASVSFVRLGNYLAAHSHSCLFQHIPSLAAATAAAAAAAADGGDVAVEKEAPGAAGAGSGAAASSVGLSSSGGAERRVAGGGGGGYKVVCGEEAAEEAEEREEVGRAMLFEYACSEALEHAAALQELHHRPPATAAAAGGGGVGGEGGASAAAAAQQQQQALRRQQQGGLRSSTRYMPSVQYLIVLLKLCVTMQEGHAVTDAHGQGQGGQVGGVGKTRSSASLQGDSIQGKEGPRQPVNSRGVQRASSVQRVGGMGVRGGAGAESTGLRETKSDSDVASSERASAGRKGEGMGESVRAGVGRRKELLFTRLACRLTAMPTALSLADLVFLGPATSLLLLHSLRDASLSHANHPTVPPLPPHAGGALPPLPSQPPPAPTTNGTGTSITSSSGGGSGRRVAVRVVGSAAAALGGDLVCDYVHYLAARMTHQSQHHTWLPFLRLCPAWPGLSSFLIDLIALLNLLFPDARHLPPVPELWTMVDVSALSDDKLALAGKMCCAEGGQGGDAGGDGGERGGGWGGGWGGRGREQGRGWWSEGRVLAQQVEREQRARGVRAEGEWGKEGEKGGREGGMRGEVERERRGRQERALQQAALEVESVRAASTRLALETAQVSTGGGGVAAAAGGEATGDSPLLPAPSRTPDSLHVSASRALPPFPWHVFLPRHGWVGLGPTRHTALARSQPSHAPVHLRSHPPAARQGVAWRGSLTPGRSSPRGRATGSGRSIIPPECSRPFSPPTRAGMASDPCPWETLQQRGLDADMVVDIDGVTWPLHRHVLLPHCPLLHSLLPAAAAAAATASAPEGDHGFTPLALGTGLPIVALQGFPGGPRAFSIIARWCYGSRLKLSPSQAAAVLFAARFLGMDDRGSEALIPVAVRAVKGGLAEGWQACFDILERCYHDRVLDALVVEFSLNRHFVDSACSEFCPAPSCGVEAALATLTLSIPATHVHLLSHLIHGLHFDSAVSLSPGLLPLTAHCPNPIHPAPSLTTGAIVKLESKLVGDGRWGNDDWATVNRLLEGMSKLPPAISRRVVQQLWDLRCSLWASVCPAPCSDCNPGDKDEHPGIRAMATVGSFLLGITLLSKMEWRKQQEEEEENKAKKGGKGLVGSSSSSPGGPGNSPSAQALSSGSSRVRGRAQPPYDNILWMLRVLKLFISPPFDRPILLVLSSNMPLLEVQHLQFLDLPSCVALLTLVSAAPRQDSHLVAAADLLDAYLTTAGTKRNPPLSAEDFRALATRLPPEARPRHDGLFEAVCAFAEVDPRPATWNLLALVDCGRLSPRCLRVAASAAASMEFGQSAVAGFWLFLVSLLRALMYEG
ncbi:unnamed protein product [Closterium sp. Naga37s-1]|nr:unnamed protein product [Closterium sp. Naga37s-1]